MQREIAIIKEFYGIDTHTIHQISGIEESVIESYERGTPPSKRDANLLSSMMNIRGFELMFMFSINGLEIKEFHRLLSLTTEELVKRKKWAKSYEAQTMRIDHFQNHIGCTCPNDEKTGVTEVDCCNICGRPDDDIWNGKMWPDEESERELSVDEIEDETLADFRSYVKANYTSLPCTILEDGIQAYQKALRVRRYEEKTR